jgi:hypothetical protein
MSYAQFMRAVAAALAAVALAVPAAAAAKVTAPDGDYTGPRHFFMRASGDSIEILAFDFPCHKHPKAHGRTSLNDIPLKKRRDGYKFSIKAYGLVGYSNKHVEENGVTSISGQFGRKGKSAHGRFQSSTRYCGATGKLNWSAELSASQAR